MRQNIDAQLQVCLMGALQILSLDLEMWWLLEVGQKNLLLLQWLLELNAYFYNKFIYQRWKKWVSCIILSLVELYDSKISVNKIINYVGEVMSWAISLSFSANCMKWIRNINITLLLSSGSVGRVLHAFLIRLLRSHVGGWFERDIIKLRFQGIFVILLRHDHDIESLL